MSSEKEFDLDEWSAKKSILIPLVSPKITDLEQVEVSMRKCLRIGFRKGQEQLAKRDEEIARRAFEAGAKRKEINETVHWEEAQRRGFRFLAGDERETVEFFVRTQTATDYINSEEFKKR